MSKSPVPTHLGRARPFFAAGLVLLLFLSASLPLVFARYSKGRAAADQKFWHLPVIRQFARELPHPNLRDYASATTPGYHLALAAVARVAGSTDERFLRLIGMLVTVGLLLTLSVAAGRRTNAATAIALCLPVVASPYVFSSGVWILPDNAGWLLVFLGMMLALRRRIDALFYVNVAIIMLALVWVRQTNAWVAAPLLMAAWLGINPPTRGQTREPDSREAIGRLATAILAMLPAIVSLVVFFRLWHGLVPPNQRALVSGGNAATPAAVFATIGLIGAFFAGFLPRQVFSCRGLVLAVMGALLGTVIALVPETTYNVDAGRFSGLWNLALHFPVLFGRSSTIIVALSMTGGMVLGLWAEAMPARQRWICVSGLVAFIAAQSANHNAYYRYFEPAVLMAAIFTVLSFSPCPPRWAVAGPILLALLLAGTTCLSIR